ncbi:L-rhamnose-binding lectin CSL3 [Nematostella vectensis]|uniref:L-rhamnose-binding lectin CSL3 n=1 Tax=Nematostella vectensis TaxID=45351 RepID=UPI002076F39E|nr:L-rhamnose-binding lectin CSL3 [Nematostella vectensis]XP_048581565.1 L-rhamnose-binding lectin CSL3 [Nematostella vectensis]
MLFTKQGMLLFPWAFILASFLNFQKKVHGCKIVPWFPEFNGTWLQNHIIQNLTTPTSNQCQATCFANDSCRSYNFCQELELCQLSNSDHVEHPDDKVPRKGFVYRGTENACASGPCPSVLLCQADFVHDSYTCVCPAEQPDCLTQPPIITCENHKAEYSCPQGTVLDIQWALFARSAQEPCPHSANSICTAQYPQTLAKVREYCQGKRSCSFHSSSSLVGRDPCPNVYKYLETRYACKWVPL